MAHSGANPNVGTEAIQPMKSKRMDCRHKDIVVEQRQRAARLEFMLLLACRLGLLIVVVIWLGLMVGRILAFTLFALTRALAG